MTRFRGVFPYILFGIASVLELMLITSVANKVIFSSIDLGPWGLEMSDSLSSVISWIVVVLVAAAFVLSWVAVRFWSMLMIMLLTVFVELLWGKVLPSPQNRWDLALAFLAGALLMFMAALRETDFINNARERLRTVWRGSPAT